MLRTQSGTHEADSALMYVLSLITAIVSMSVLFPSSSSFCVFVCMYAARDVLENSREKRALIVAFDNFHENTHLSGRFKLPMVSRLVCKIPKYENNLPLKLAGNFCTTA